MKRYSAWQLFKQGLTGQTGWSPAWRQPDPKPAYDVIIIGGGGHGLATAYYLAKIHGITNVACWKRAGLGGVIQAATPLLCAQIILLKAIPLFTNIP